MDTDRTERFELRLTKEEARDLRASAADAGTSAADYLRQLLARTRDEKARLTRQAKLETLAFVSLNEMTNRQGITCAVVFTTNPSEPHLPVKRADGGPQPKASNILQAPMIGNVVAQGFAKTLTEGEKAVVEARFPGQIATWAARPQ